MKDVKYAIAFIATAITCWLGGAVGAPGLLVLIVAGLVFFGILGFWEEIEGALIETKDRQERERRLAEKFPPEPES